MDTKLRAEDTVPLYDLFDGLSRRRRLIRAGKNPDQLVSVRAYDGQTLCLQYPNTPLRDEAVA